MANLNPTELDCATVFKDENGIIIITMKDCGVLDEFDIVNINIAIRYKTGGKPALKLLDARADWSMSKKAKEQAQTENSSSKTKARAIVLSGIIKAGLLKFMQGFSKFNYPQKVFTDYDQAYEWLLSQENNTFYFKCKDGLLAD